MEPKIQGIPQIKKEKADLKEKQKEMENTYLENKNCIFFKKTYSFQWVDELNRLGVTHSWKVSWCTGCQTHRTVRTREEYTCDGWRRGCMSQRNHEDLLELMKDMNTQFLNNSSRKGSTDLHKKCQATKILTAIIIYNIHIHIHKYKCVIYCMYVY